MVLGYVMLAYSGVVEGQAIGNRLAEVLSFGIVMSIVATNFYILVKGSYLKLRATLKKQTRKKPKTKK